MGKHLLVNNKSWKGRQDESWHTRNWSIHQADVYNVCRMQSFTYTDRQSISMMLLYFLWLPVHIKQCSLSKILCLSICVTMSKHTRYASAALLFCSCHNRELVKDPFVKSWYATKEVGICMQSTCAAERQSRWCGYPSNFILHCFQCQQLLFTFCLHKFTLWFLLCF